MQARYLQVGESVGPPFRTEMQNKSRGYFKLANKRKIQASGGIQKQRGGKPSLLFTTLPHAVCRSMHGYCHVWPWLAEFSCVAPS